MKYCLCCYGEVTDLLPGGGGGDVFSHAPLTVIVVNQIHIPKKHSCCPCMSQHEDVNEDTVMRFRLF